MNITRGLINLFFTNDNKSNHFKSLDGLRGIAVLLVLLSHSSNESIFFHEMINFHSAGKIGVYLFFVLSAYLLDRQIAIAFKEKKSNKQYWKNYFLRRFLRIYPLFIIALIIHGLFTIIGIETVINKITDIPLHMALVKGESIFWSIPVEFKYYFISPFILWICNKYLNWAKYKVLLFFIFLLLLTIAIELIFHLPQISTLRFFPIFLVGTIISIYELFYIKNKYRFNYKRFYNFIGAISFLLILISFPFYSLKFFNYKMKIHTSIFYLPYAILWGIILLSARFGMGFFRKFLELKFLRFMGIISYSAYLFHFPILKLILAFETPQFLKVYIFFALTLMLSSLSYLLIERPLSKIRIN